MALLLLVMAGLGLLRVIWSRRRREYKRRTEADLDHRLAEYLKEIPKGSGGKMG
jgi:hypothetical protein